jgi:hypothetical protein
MNFLENFLGYVDFPPAIGLDMVERYCTEYADIMAYNESLLHGAVGLLGYTEVVATSWLATAPSLPVLYALLDSDEARTRVLCSLSDCWSLSILDQWRFIDRALTLHTLDRILTDVRFCLDVRMAGYERREEACAQLSSDERSRYEQRWEEANATLVSSKEFPASSRHRPECRLERREPLGRVAQRLTPRQSTQLARKLLKLSANEFSHNEHVRTQSMGALSAYLADTLGDGTGEDDAARWFYFIDLACDKPGVALEEIIRDASNGSVDN